MIELPDTTYVSRIADWIELQVISSGNAISKSKIISIIDNYLGDADELKIDSAIQELVRRLHLYGDVKPYNIENNVIRPNFLWTEYPEFTMCLLFSTYGASNADIGTKLFERLTQCCIHSLFKFESINFGFPSGMSFVTQVDDLAAKCYEGREDDPTSFDKDRGVDIVAWKPFGDGRNSHIYLLVQCAAGGKWREKKQIPLTSWRRYIKWNHQTTIPAISITQIIESEKWKNAADDYGIIIDRARLFKTVSSKEYFIDSDLKNEIKNWCEVRL